MDGVVAQLVEHHNGIVGVAGSIPVGSTILEISVLRDMQGRRFSVACLISQLSFRQLNPEISISLLASLHVNLRNFHSVIVITYRRIHVSPLKIKLSQCSPSPGNPEHNHPVKKTISTLLTLQTLELQSPKKRGSEALKLREQIPAEMLTRFDKFLGRGKKGVALVQNGVCRGCQIGVPVGIVNSLIEGVGTQVCGNCGRYLYLEEADALSFKGGARTDTITVTKVKAPSLTAKVVRPRAKKTKVAGELAASGKTVAAKV